MIRDDMIYQVLFKYDFNLFRGDKCISEYMKDHCIQYYIDICEAVKGDNPFLGEAFINLLKEKLEDLNYVCKAIPKILALNDGGLISDIYEESFQLFEKMRTYLRVGYLWKDDAWAYYRIREGDFRIKSV